MGRMLRVDSLTKSYGGEPVCREVSLALAPGEFVALLGESGVGKSTLLNCIAGLDRPDSGRVWVAAQDVTSLDDDGCARLRRHRLGLVLQAFHVLTCLSVADNVALPLSLLGVAERQLRARVGEMLELVGLGNRAASLPRELSGGELQRVAIARALVHRPKLLLADEPTGNLDPETARAVLDLLRLSVREAGAAGILVTHSPEAAATADRVMILGADGMRQRPDAPGP